MTPNDWAVARARHDSEVRVEQSTLTLFESAQSWVAVDALCMAGRRRASGEMAGSFISPRRSRDPELPAANILTEYGDLVSYSRATRKVCPLPLCASPMTFPRR